MSNIKNLLFDLDGTLYPYSSGTQDLFEQRIVIFFQKKFAISEQEAVSKRNEFMKLYRNNNGSFNDVSYSDKKEFMDFICDIDVSMLKPNKNLADILRMLPQRKFIITDSTQKHVKDTLKQIGIDENIFSGISDCESNGFIFKPQEEVFHNIASSYGLNFSQSAFFEDKVKNLEIAKELGMTTILISENEQPTPKYVDYQFHNVLEALNYLFKNIHTNL